MKCRARGLLPFAALAWALLLAASPQAAAQRPTGRINPLGTEAFRLILHGSGLKPIEEISDLEKNKPRETLIIVFGKLDPLDEIDSTIEGGLRGFLGHDGAILVASDRSAGSRLLEQEFKVVPSGTVVTNPKEAMAFGGNKNFPFVTGFPLRKHPLFKGVERLATNAPAYLQPRGRMDLHILAQFPERCVDEHGLLQGEPIFAVGNDAPEGSKLILAGHGVFVNDEMYNKDNILFARNCIDWFTRSKDGKKTRDKVLFIHEGEISSKFDVPLRRLPAPPLPTIQRLNNLIRGLERENFFNKLLLTAAGTGGGDDKEIRMAIGRERILRYLGILLGVLVLVHLCIRLRRSRYYREGKVPLLASNLSHVSTEALIDQRQRGMLYEGNLWEAARELARQCFAEYVGHALAFNPPRPQAIVRARGWRGTALEKMVRQLWDLAYGPPKPVLPPRFRQLIAEAEEVKEALASGALVLHEPAPEGKTQPPPHLVGSPALS
jgi:hypothetical protein